MEVKGTMIRVKTIFWSISGILALAAALMGALPARASQTAPFSYAIERQTNLPVLVEGEFAEVEIKLRNTGSQPWNPGEVLLINKRNPYGASREYSIANSVPPGGALTFNWQTEPFAKWGVFTSDWQLQHLGQNMEGAPIRVQVIVLPKQLEEKRAELQAKVRDWVDQKVQNIEAQILAWIQQQLDQAVKDTTRQLCGSPLLPIFAVLGLWIWRRKLLRG